MEKNFINGAFVYFKTFDNGGTVVNANINVDEFIEQLQSIKDDKGFARVTFARRLNAQEGKPNGYCYENTYKREDGAPEKAYSNVKLEDIEL